MNIDNKILNDEWTTSGRTLESLNDAIDVMGKITSTFVWDGNINLIHITDLSDDYLHGLNISGGYEKKLTSVRFAKETIIEEGLDDSFFHDIHNNPDIILRAGENGENNILFTGGRALVDLGIVCKLGGDGFNKSSVERDVFLLSLLKENKKIKDRHSFVVRNYKNIYKCFAVRSLQFVPDDLSIVKTVISRLEQGVLGTGAVENWYMDHDIVRVYMSFEEQSEKFQKKYGTDLVPVVSILDSSIGECSLIIRTGWKMKQGYVIQDELRIKHTGTWNEEEIMKSLNENLFPEMEEIPKTLSELFDVDVTTKDMKKTPKRATLKSLFSVLWKTGIFKAFKNEGISSRIRDELIEEFLSQPDCTGYDVAMAVMNLSSRIPEHMHERADLQKMLCQAPFTIKKWSESNKKIITLLGA